MPSPLPSFARSAAAKIEDLPSDGGKTVDTLAGGLLRTFIRLNELEAALAKVTSRVAVLEGKGPMSDMSRTQKAQPFSLPEKEAYLSEFFGGCTRTRTSDPLIKSHREHQGFRHSFQQKWRSRPTGNCRKIGLVVRQIKEFGAIVQAGSLVLFTRRQASSLAIAVAAISLSRGR
jgi:hypothetical protein